jgi:hypothetical protein
MPERYAESLSERPFPPEAWGLADLLYNRINRGSIPDLSRPEGDSDFYFVRADNPDVAVTRIIELGVGARSLNIELQAALNGC